MVRVLSPNYALESTRRGFCELRSAYNVELVKLLKKYPASHWDKKRRVYEVPSELMPWVAAWANKHLGWDLNVPTVPERKYKLEKKLYPFQAAGTTKLVRNGFGMLSFEMGLGKTVSTIAALRHERCKRIFVVCPAIVRQVWVDEIAKWWPDAPEVYVADTSSKAAKAPASGVVITSYHLVSYVPLHMWDVVVLDESHMAKNEASGMGKHCVELGRARGDALKIALSGTPVAQEPKDLWAQMEFLRPGGFGSKWQFMQRYVGREPNEYARSGYTWTGADNEEEFAARLEYFLSRATRAEVAHVLPKVTTKALGVVDKARALVDLVQPTASPVLVFAFRRNTVHKMAEQLRAQTKRQVFTATGEQTPAARHAVIRSAAGIKNAILVATMDALGTGVDLTAFPFVFFVELPPKLSVVRQALGRVCRLSSSLPVDMTFLYEKSSLDERRMVLLQKKLNEVNKVIQPGHAENDLGSFLSGEYMTDDDWCTALADELGGWDDEEDGYV